ncbi:IS3 family transposase [Algoriphagus resistens]|uniref:IS3 family transposase n=1 Tax=Algoriphagus resistens TaxID=1750590 RepID=UPI0009EB8003|nr:IS3 family transposase [Algoriphagus resistens]
MRVSCFYRWLVSPESRGEQRIKLLVEKIQKVHKASRYLYGSPRITAELHKTGDLVSRSYVARLMNRYGIRSKVKKKYKITTDSSHNYRIAENLLQRDFSADSLSRKWVGDITYIHTDKGWLYLTTVIDLEDRKVIGWSLSTNMTAGNTTVAAIKMAVGNRAVKNGLIYHSDRGVQYACDEFKAILSQNNIIQSMSRKANCWDNAVAESFFKSLKTEMVYHRRFMDQQSAKLEVFGYIEGFYNTKRTHSALGYKTPKQMEEMLLGKERLAA